MVGSGPNCSTTIYVQQEPESKPDRPISLYICGPTRSGKTQWARSLGRHNYFTGSLSFLDYDDFALYNVIDDIEYEKISTSWFKSLLGAQKDIILKGKYMKDFRISGGIPCIVLVNEDMDWVVRMASTLKPWFDDNVLVYYMSASDKFY
uniref:Replication-associated protein n=1 Tax=Mulberry mosaic dwarf associated virus TaxID=1631303 RepID=A0A6G7SK61_9GEMI|nr:putative C1:C2-like protein [Mulberry mosaic dwarf associated virus]